MCEQTLRIQIMILKLFIKTIKNSWEIPGKVEMMDNPQFVAGSSKCEQTFILPSGVQAGAESAEGEDELAGGTRRSGEETQPGEVWTGKQKLSDWGNGKLNQVRETHT